jgi:hypothetical protein
MGNPANFGPAQLGFWLHQRRLKSLGKKQVGKSMAQARPELSAHFFLSFLKKKN